MAKRDVDGSRAERRRLIESFLAEREATGESYRELSERTGIPVPTLSWWQRKLATEGGRGEEIELVEIEHPVQLSGPTLMLEVVVPGGTVVRVPPGCDPEMVAELVAAVAERC